MLLLSCVVSVVTVAVWLVSILLGLLASASRLVLCKGCLRTCLSRLLRLKFCRFGSVRHVVRVALRIRLLRWILRDCSVSTGFPVLRRIPGELEVS